MSASICVGKNPYWDVIQQMYSLLYMRKHVSNRRLMTEVIIIETNPSCKSGPCKAAVQNLLTNK